MSKGLKVHAPILSAFSSGFAEDWQIKCRYAVRDIQTCVPAMSIRVRKQGMMRFTLTEGGGNASRSWGKDRLNALGSAEQEQTSKASSRLVICVQLGWSDGGTTGSVNESRKRRSVVANAWGIRGSSPSGKKGKSSPVSRHCSSQ